MAGISRHWLSIAALAWTCAGASPAVAALCDRDSTGMIPLIDLGAVFYQGHAGGLYPGGSNVRPPAHDAAGIAIANALTPLDTLGNPDPNGRIVLISIGMSNATQEFSTFVPKANADPTKNPRVLVVDCAQGGQATQDIRHPNAPYWGVVAQRLRASGSSPLQAQVVWIKEARRAPTGGFPASAESLTNDIGTIVRIIKDKLPNVKLAYLTSRIYGGYATGALNPEPFAYEAGFAFKWLIEAQIAGVDSLEFDAGAGAVEAPWLSWGPYLWADGLEPRSDGLTWACSDFVADGVHPDTPGRIKVADSLLAFMKRDRTTEPWFVRHATSSTPPAHQSALTLAVAPNPARGALSATIAPGPGAPWRLEIVDLAGRRVEELARGIGTGTSHTVRWDARGAQPSLYWIRLVEAHRTLAKRVVLVSP